jgi:hypothetical protein
MLAYLVIYSQIKKPMVHGFQSYVPKPMPTNLLGLIFYP